jgi:hypothetical protein
MTFASTLAIPPKAATALLTMVLTVSLQLLPLVRRQFPANRQKEARIRLFQLRPGLRHLVDPGQNPGFVRLIFLHQRLQRQLRFFQARLQVNQLLPMRKKDIVHRLPLRIGQLQLRHHLRIVPPAPLVAPRTESPLKWGSMITKSPTHAGAAAGALRARRYSRQHYSRNRQSQPQCHSRPH